MDYDSLQAAYWQRQVERVVRLRERIVARTAAPPGRVVPDDQDLAIGEGRRLYMAVMFLDICSFSRRASETPAEQELLLRILNLFFSEMIKIAEDYGGTVEKNTGDGLMAYFEDGGGTPPAGGVKRAVASALTMMAANKHLIRPILAATPTDTIDFRISIDYGAVTVARLGAAQRFNANVAIGATANFASKMLARVGGGEIVLGEAACFQLPNDWRNEYTELLATNTGWIYTYDGRPYPLYRYTGQWGMLT